MTFDIQPHSPQATRRSPLFPTPAVVSDAMQGRRGGGGDPPWSLLLAAALGIWSMACLQAGDLEAGAPLQSAARQFIIHLAGAGLCLSTIPLLRRVAKRPLGARLAGALAISLGAWLAHLGLRLLALRALGPQSSRFDHMVIAEAFRGDGWMFPLWTAIALALWDAVKPDTPAAAPPPSEAAQPLPIAADQEAHLWCLDGRRRVRVPLQHVMLIEAERDYLRLYTPGRRFLIRGRIGEIAASLPSDEFERVHRSYIVRVSAIRAVEKCGSSWRIDLGEGLYAIMSRKLGRAARDRLARFREGPRNC